MFYALLVDFFNFCFAASWAVYNSRPIVKHLHMRSDLDWSQYLRQALRDIQNRVYLPQLK